MKYYAISNYSESLYLTKWFADQGIVCIKEINELIKTDAQNKTILIINMGISTPTSLLNDLKKLRFRLDFQKWWTVPVLILHHHDLQNLCRMNIQFSYLQTAGYRFLRKPFSQTEFKRAISSLQNDIASIQDEQKLLYNLRLPLNLFQARTSEEIQYIRHDLANSSGWIKFMFTHYHAAQPQQISRQTFKQFYEQHNFQVQGDDIIFYQLFADLEQNHMQVEENINDVCMNCQVKRILLVDDQPVWIQTLSTCIPSVIWYYWSGKECLNIEGETIKGLKVWKAGESQTKKQDVTIEAIDCVLLDLYLNREDEKRVIKRDKEYFPKILSYQIANQLKDKDFSLPITGFSSSQSAVFIHQFRLKKTSAGNPVIDHYICKDSNPFTIDFPDNAYLELVYFFRHIAESAWLRDIYYAQNNLSVLLNNREENINITLQQIYNLANSPYGVDELLVLFRGLIDKILENPETNIIPEEIHKAPELKDKSTMIISFYFDTRTIEQPNEIGKNYCFFQWLNNFRNASVHHTTYSFTSDIRKEIKIIVCLISIHLIIRLLCSKKQIIQQKISINFHRSLRFFPDRRENYLWDLFENLDKRLQKLGVVIHKKMRKNKNMKELTERIQYRAFDY